MAQILFIDDDWIALNIYEKACRLLGHKAILADSGQHALLLAGKTRPALIFLDLVLAEMDGLQVLNQLRQSSDWSEIPVVILTSGVSQQDAEKVRAAGAQAYLSKPLSLDALYETIKTFANP
jgi:two-component system, cell cycle response regulator DivK